ncbi:rab-GTPase-TBC domain-containing protein, partial [Amylocystis lapponica]
MSHVEAEDHTSHADEVPDWEVYRKLSLRPRGFGTERIGIWPKLLHVTQPALSTPGSPENPAIHAATNEEAESLSHSMVSETSAASSVHRDERQIGLDTDRSFRVLPNKTEGREHLQAQLHSLIVAVFRKRQLLNYFQGYHDVISVLFLTLPEDLHMACAEKLSLHRLRDSMGASLEPVVGLLRILKRLLHLADPTFASLLEQNAPLPYFSLSHILTLFSHDVPTLPLIQHIFDYLLCRPPIVVVYLAAAVVLSRREEAHRSEDDGEEGMIHSLLSSLPVIYEEDEARKADSPLQDICTTEDITSKPEVVSEADIKQEGEEILDVEATEDITKHATTVDGQVKENLVEELSDPPSLPPLPPSPSEEDSSQTEETASEAQVFSDAETSVSTAEPDEMPHHKVESPELSEKPEADPSVVISSTTVSLTSLLMHADELYSIYPPTHPAIALDTIMGPQSVMLTWFEDPSELPSDDDAERMVLKPELVVRPVIDPEDEVASDDETDSTRRAHEKQARRRRRLRKPHRLAVQRKTMVAGAVLVLGVAMAVYGINAGGVFRANE